MLLCVALKVHCIGQLGFLQWWNFQDCSVVALTQISAYSTHKNLAVCRIMEVVRTTYAKSRIQSQQVVCTRQMIREGTRVLWKESVHRLQTFQYFAESFDGSKGALEMHHSFLYFIGMHFHSIMVHCIVQFHEYSFHQLFPQLFQEWINLLQMVVTTWCMEMTGHRPTIVAKIVGTIGPFPLPPSSMLRIKLSVRWSDPTLYGGRGRHYIVLLYE